MSLLKLVLIISLPLYILDQITKWWIVLTKDIGVEHPVIENFFNITRVHNQGVAFGLGNGTSWAPVVFLLILPIALCMIIFLCKKDFFVGKLGMIAAPLLISGIVGNLTDRLFQGFWLPEYADASFFDRLMQGYVVDFLDVRIPIIDYPWPTFNVADSCIVVAAFCLFLSSFNQPPEEKQDEDNKPQAT